MHQQFRLRLINWASQPNCAAAGFWFLLAPAWRLLNPGGAVHPRWIKLLRYMPLVPENDARGPATGRRELIMLASSYDLACQLEVARISTVTRLIVDGDCTSARDRSLWAFVGANNSLADCANGSDELLHALMGTNIGLISILMLTVGYFLYCCLSRSKVSKCSLIESKVPSLRLLNAALVEHMDMLTWILFCRKWHV